MAAAGCGRGSGVSEPRTDVRTTVETRDGTAQTLGFPFIATKNTTRVAGATPVEDAAGAARAVFTAGTRLSQPAAVVIADDRDWRVGLVASSLMSAPIRAPLLYSHAGKLPAASAAALRALKPTGAAKASGAAVIRLANSVEVNGLRTTDVPAANPFALARAVDAFQSAARGAAGDRVLVVSADDPAYAMPAAAWAAKSGDPILFTRRDDVPADTLTAIAAHQRPKIYVLGPPSVVSAAALARLRRLGTVQRISGPDPAATAVAFARFIDGSFGWGVVDPGHGLVFANPRRPGDAAAAAPLSASGTYGPLLLLSESGTVPASLEQFLLDIQPGYTRDPVRGVYNHGWLIGDGGAIPTSAQSRLDSLLEIVPISQRESQSSSP
jgi:hypothetical protein